MGPKGKGKRPPCDRPLWTHSRLEKPTLGVWGLFVSQGPLFKSFVFCNFYNSFGLKYSAPPGMGGQPFPVEGHLEARGMLELAHALARGIGLGLGIGIW